MVHHVLATKQKKKAKKIWNSALLKKFGKSLRNDLNPDPFITSADPGSASKLNGS